MTVPNPQSLDMPLVSVVVPTFNRAALLAETLASILAQTYPRLELIIVDNLSTDDTEAYLQSLHDHRVRRYRNANDGVIARNRNLGIKAARGKYVALCDDDDLWQPEKLAEQVAVMESNERIGLCYTNAAVFGDNGVSDTWLIKTKVFHNHFTRLLLRNFIPNSSVLIRKNVLDAAGGFDESANLAPFEDYELWLRIAHSHPLAYIDKPLLKYRIHGANWAGKYGNRQRIVINVLQSVRKKLGIIHPLLYVAIALRYLKAVISS